MSASVALLAVRLLAPIVRDAPEGLIVVVDGDQRAEGLARLLAQLAPERSSTCFPAWDCLPYDRAAPSADIMGHRMRVLHDLAKRSDGAVVVTTPEAIIQRIPPRGCVEPPIVVERGAKLDLEAFGIACTRLGYAHADRVDDPGHVAIRGEVVDIFPPIARPHRITVLDGAVTAIHPYDPTTQRSTGDVARLRIDPVSEIVPREGDPIERFPGVEHWLPAYYPETETLLDRLPKARLLIEPEAEAGIERLFEQVAEAYRERVATDKADPDGPRKACEPASFFLSAAQWKADAVPRQTTFPSLDAASPVHRFCLDDKPGQAFAAYLDDRRSVGRRVVVSAARDSDIAVLTREVRRATGHAPVRIAAWEDLGGLAADRAGLMKLSADRGFDDEQDGVTLITAADLLGHHARTSAHAVPMPWHLGDGEFAIGDVVIHVDHGVGLLEALEVVDGGAASGREMIRLSYAKGTDLLVPVDELDRIWRYAAGADGVALDKLDTEAWQRRQAKIVREVKETASSLVELAQQRNETAAPRLVPPRRAYERFVAGFPFAPTPDQMHACDDCLRDLAAGRPMDRLVVGDVGFGKTEVALRAAAAAVLSGRQVAVVAPTTVLVRQHVQSFETRFADLGIEVANLSRLVSPAEAQRVKAGLADGSVRLVVGTQALAGQDVAFKDLGLLIIDEEQRFGRADKTQIRGLGDGVHVLTLSATPIPRTLQAALVGLQDLSVIATPPARRRPIRTLLSPFDLSTIGVALTKEKARGGQSFVVVPRIDDLDPLAAELGALVPGLSIVVGHGRMEAHEVDDAMIAFAAGRGDVLLATSIIESGLDVPRANTMVICDADRFGLAELHQLRGRVGRGRRQGVCYLMTGRDRALSPASERRLATLAKLDRLGSGMAISAHDLDARGAGDLMGDDQAGHMRLIGLGMYQHLLQLAIREARGEPAEDWSPELHVAGTGRLGEDYIPEPEVRLNLYARLARAVDLQEVDGLLEEVEDRFGPLPDTAVALFTHARLRSLCKSHHVARVDAGPKAIAFTPRKGVLPESLLDVATSEANPASRVKDGRVIYDVLAETDESARLKMSLDLLHALP